MRFVYACLCVILIAWAAFSAEPPKQAPAPAQAPGKKPGDSGVVIQAPVRQVQVCQNGVCRLVSVPEGTASVATSQPVAREGWYPGKLLGRKSPR